MLTLSRRRSIGRWRAGAGDQGAVRSGDMRREGSAIPPEREQERDP
jgi:hypothetical protein